MSLQAEKLSLKKGLDEMLKYGNLILQQKRYKM